MTATLPHEIAWVAAAPLWKEAVRTPLVLRRPTLLGFGRDDFMEELLGTLAEKPEGIAEHLATGPSRSYRERFPGEAYDVKPTVKHNQLKLYQPVHGWFYLVTGSLVCQLPGLPDHPVDLGADESAGFILRRRTDPSQELALVAGPFGKKFWKAVGSDPEKLVPGEEVLPLFPLGFREADRSRKLLAGLIPTGNQDFFLAAPVGDKPPDEGGQPPDAVALEGMKARVTRAIDALKPDPPAGTEDQRPEISRFALMDLADFLTFYLPRVMQAVKDGSNLTGKAQALVQLLRNTTVDGTSYADLLKTILSLPLTTAFTHNLGQSITPDSSGTLGSQLQGGLEAALQESPSGVPAVSADVQSPGSTSFVARLVYRRPHCAPLKPEVVSPPSEPFVMAPYFDPEAPARPIRIAMPFDPSIKGLRQFKKNVRMVLSDALKQKVKRGSINDKMDGPDVDCGALELSIPIITIVAMIILFVFIAVLNIIFWWIPFVKICLPGITIEPEPEP